MLLETKSTHNDKIVHYFEDIKFVKKHTHKCKLRNVESKY